MSTTWRCSAAATKPLNCSSGCSACRNDVGLLAEEYDPRTKRQLGNFPQAFSHVALVSSALNLNRSEPAKPAEQRASGEK